ncbi:MAG: hypothetical protein CMM07_10475 [Rhodopirellula sp.]|nr:hypothetical protein [Rhodopirellula sp.]
MLFLLELSMKNLFFTAATTLSIFSASYFLPAILPREGEKILSDVGSEIRLVACSATSARTSSLRNAELVSNIVNGLPEDVHVLLLVNDRSAFATSSNNNRVTFVEMPSGSDISIWPQDPFVVVQGKATTKLITPCSFNREDDERMPQQLASLLNLEVVHSEMHFEGGNIVCSEDSVFIGFDTITHNAVLLDASPKSIVKRFAKLFGRPVTVVGKSSQPIGHIDLIVTPLGENRVAVADSRAGARLAAAAIDENPGLVQTFERSCEEMFFGHKDVAELRARDGKFLLRPKVSGQTDHVMAASLRIAPELDSIARQLSHEGYTVVRVPALIPGQFGSGNESLEKDVMYPFLSYSNVLVEERQNQSVVYLPQYGFKKLDEAAVQAWKSLGYRVTPVSGFSTSSMYGGGLRCCTKVLLRD